MQFSPENYPPRNTAEKGKSKIEQGLREFRIYRVAPNYKLLRLQSMKVEPNSHGSFDELLNRGLFFTTQKNMALEYRVGEDAKSVLLEQKGMDFLSDLQKLEDQGLKIILFSHENLIAYQKMRSHKYDEAETKNFLAKHTFSPSQVSPRMLRRSAEIIILMPEQLDVLPLHTKTIKKQGVGEIPSKTRHQARKNFNLPGQFHQKIVDINKKPNMELKRLRRKLKKNRTRKR